MNRPEIVARRIGREGEPLVTIDHFAPDPDTLRAAAAHAAFSPAGRHYPGLRAPLPESYLPDTQAAIATVLRDVFGFQATMRVLDASFSMVITPPEQLTIEQRLPHVDATAPDRIALIHYLAPDCGGTAFYRHRATRFEAITDARGSAYYARLNAEIAAEPPSLAYIDGDTSLFEQIALGEPRYNRALIYRSRLLHSGVIADGAALSSDPLTGRLTVTAFFSGR